MELWALVYWLCLSGFMPQSGFEDTKYFFSVLQVATIRYCGEHPGQTGLKFQILCVQGSVVWFISSSLLCFSSFILACIFTKLFLRTISFIHPLVYLFIQNKRCINNELPLQVLNGNGSVRPPPDQ